MIEETLARSIFKINPQAIAKAAIESISKLHPEVREILFQSKNEQTFSSLLASELNSTFGLKHTSFLTEIKGETITRKDLKKVPNFHDIALLDADGKIEVRDRKSGSKNEVPINEALSYLVGIFK